MKWIARSQGELTRTTSPESIFSSKSVQVYAIFNLDFMPKIADSRSQGEDQARVARDLFTLFRSIPLAPFTHKPNYTCSQGKDPAQVPGVS